MQELSALRETGTVGQIIDRIRAERRPRLPDSIEDREIALKVFDRNSGEELPATLSELEKFHDVSYAEVKALRIYLDGHSPFETKHGVKGAEFENVLVVIGRGWNQYNFGDMLEMAGSSTIPPNKMATFERNRNLFYVACSRPKRRLALLFTQKLPPGAIATLCRWFGADTVESLNV